MAKVNIIELLLVWWPLWIAIGVCLVVVIAKAIIIKRRIARSGIGEIDRMDGIGFERYLETVFQRFGYHVERTPARGDYGADLIISKNNTRTAIQAKRYRQNVGVKAVQEIVTAKKMYNCSGGIVITNSYYTQQAQKLATVNQVTLWDRDKLIKVILMLQRNIVDPNISEITA